MNNPSSPAKTFWIIVLCCLFCLTGAYCFVMGATPGTGTADPGVRTGIVTGLWVRVVGLAMAGLGAALLWQIVRNIRHSKASP